MCEIHPSSDESYRKKPLCCNLPTEAKSGFKKSKHRFPQARRSPVHSKPLFCLLQAEGRFQRLLHQFDLMSSTPRSIGLCSVYSYLLTLSGGRLRARCAGGVSV